MSCPSSCCCARCAERSPAPNSGSGAYTPPPVPSSASAPSGGDLSLGDLIQFKVGVQAPPDFTPGVYSAVAALREAHRRAQRPLITVTEWYRSPEQNLLTRGASATSLHQTGLAFDLRADAGGAAVARAWRELGFRILTPEQEVAKGSAPHWHLELQRA